MHGPAPHAHPLPLQCWYLSATHHLAGSSTQYSRHTCCFILLLVSWDTNSSSTYSGFPGAQWLLSGVSPQSCGTCTPYTDLSLAEVLILCPPTTYPHPGSRQNRELPPYPNPHHCILILVTEQRNLSSLCLYLSLCPLSLFVSVIKKARSS